MKNLLLIPIFLFSLFVNSQTLIEYDRMETSSTLYTSAGWWTPALTTGWYNNASVSPTLSATIYGSGAGTSANEQDWYSMPNKVGLDPSKQYQLKFRLASFTYSNSTATTRGLDAADILEVQLSTNGGVSYVTELRITGNSNARWDYNSTGVINHTANGSFTNSAAPTGDVYQSPAGVTTTGPSTVYLNLPSGISQIAIDIFCRVNSAGEEWWIDDIELWDITPVSLPVELTFFEGVKVNNVNIIKWQTASEHNTDYYLIQKSTTGEFNDNSTINKIEAAGNSNNVLNYNVSDFDFESVINYYRLVQFDKDGKFEIYGPIAIDNRNLNVKFIKLVNVMGQEVDENYKGVLFEIYSDGTSKKIYR